MVLFPGVVLYCRVSLYIATMNVVAGMRVVINRVITCSPFYTGPDGISVNG